MKTQKETTLRCRTCSESYTARCAGGGRWRTEFETNPPSPICRQHRGNQLCRYAVARSRDQLRRQLKPIVKGKPAAFVTLVPPRRAVRFSELATVQPQDELRSIRRVLPPLPAGAVAVGWLDIGIRDLPGDDGDRQRWWLPHLHLVVIGLDRLATKQWLGRPYRPSWLVRLPQRVKPAPTPLNALDYALSHADDVMADVVLVNPTGPRRRVLKPRWLKPEERAELRAFMAQYAIADMLLLIGLRRFGSELGHA